MLRSSTQRATKTREARAKARHLPPNGRSRPNRCHKRILTPGFKSFQQTCLNPASFVEQTALTWCLVFITPVFGRKCAPKCGTGWCRKEVSALNYRVYVLKVTRRSCGRWVGSCQYRIHLIIAASSTLTAAAVFRCWRIGCYVRSQMHGICKTS